MEVEDKIKKLPKWAQEHIKDVTQKHHIAVRALNEYCDDQTESAFSVTDGVCTGEKPGPSMKKRYIQAYKMDVNHQGVHLQIINRDDGIYLSWGVDKYNCGEVACIPHCHQSIRLVPREGMRT